MSILNNLREEVEKAFPDIEIVVNYLSDLVPGKQSLNREDLDEIFLMLRSDDDSFDNVNDELIHFLDLYNVKDVDNSFLNTCKILKDTRIEWAGTVLRRLTGTPDLAATFLKEFEMRDISIRSSIADIMDSSLSRNSKFDSSLIDSIRESVGRK